ncbi:MAG: LysR family transcriptional regulator [Christensenellales bacterium]|nr:LysR family transcriptional regulator [Christensenellales bacterium]
MDIKQLLTMITLSQTFNYQKAAEQLQYAPSTLFKHIQMLEQEVGAPLFGKTGRQLRLTSQGKAFLVHAKRMVEEYYLALDSVCAEEKLEGTITVGGCEINTAYSLLSLFEGFSRSHAEVRLNMMTSHNAGVPALIRGDMLDVGFFYTTRAGAVSGLRTIPLYREPVYLMVAWDNPMAQKKKLKYEDLTGMPFVYPHDTCCFVGEFLPMMEQMGIHLGKVTFLGGVQLVMERARQEGAMTLVPHRASRQYAEVYGMVRLDMDEEPIWAWENVVYKNYETLKPAARALARYCAIYASDLTKKDAVLRVQESDC